MSNKPNLPLTIIENNNINNKNLGENNEEMLLTNNDMLQILNIIDIIQSRGKIKSKDMYKIGSRYLRLSSYLEFSQFDKQEQKNIIDNEKRNENSDKYLKKIDIQDLVFYFNFIDLHIKKENFNNRELEAINLVYHKIFNTLKPYITDNSDKQDNILPNI